MNRLDATMKYTHIQQPPFSFLSSFSAAAYMHSVSQKQSFRHGKSTEISKVLGEEDS